MNIIDRLSQIHWLESAAEIPLYFCDTLLLGFEGVGFTASPDLHRVKQVHGAHIVEANDFTSGSSLNNPEADGIMSFRPGQRLGIKTADCLPVIISGTNGLVIVHAGWRGLAAGIVENGIRQLVRRGTRPDELLVAMGPSIALPNYEVGPEVIESFRKGSSGAKDDAELNFCIYKARKDRWHIDIAGIAALKCLRTGVAPQNIAVIRSCTYSNPSLWNSFRREGRVIASNWTWAELR